MSKKRDNLFERYVDKVVLGIIGVLCLWLLGVFVLGNPYTAEYDGKKLGPGEIDSYIEKQEVHQLLSRLEEAPKPKIYNKNSGTGFAKKFACSISNISDDVHIPIPGYAGKVSVDSRIYLVPEIDEVSNAAVERVRSVAYVPAEVVGVDNPYRSVAAELGDIDFVTVEVSFDVASLYKNFEQCFAGRGVRRDWHDKNLAKPVFAAVGLERRRLLDNGGFGEWQEVPRTKIDYLKSMLNDIPEKVDDKHTVNLLMVKFDEFYVQKDILQPEAYDFAASNENWLTPKFHREYAKLLKAEEEKIRREQQRGTETGGRASQMGRLGGTTGSRRSTGASRSGSGRSGGTGARGGRAGTSGTRGRTNTGGRRDDRSRRTSARTRTDGSGLTDLDRAQERDKRKKEERKAEDVYKDFEKVLMTDKTKLDKMREPLVFWAHDDTVVPGQSYQYRIRLGVFNPIAGRDWFREDQKHFKEEPILWSRYSDVSETVNVPPMMHFFPLDVAPGEEKSVKIKVAKYHYGRWRSEDFEVRPGEVIGKVVEKELKEKDRQLGQLVGYAQSIGGSDGNSKVEVIDYSTGAALVDVVQTSDWTGINVLRERNYADILYTKDDVSIEHLAVKNRNWPTELQQQFNAIKATESEVVTLRGRGSGGFQQFGPSGGRSTRPGGQFGGRLDRYRARGIMPRGGSSLTR
jgi:uncharacterized membrane protein YgcG